MTRAALYLAAVALVWAGPARAQIDSNIRILKLTDYLTAFYDGRPTTPPPKSDGAAHVG